MKKTVLYFFISSFVLASLSGKTFSQITPASAIWQPESSSNIPGNAVVSGDIQAAPQGGTMEAYQYSSTATAVNDATGWQRSRSTTSAPTVPYGNVYDPDFYLEYQVKPADLKYLRITSVKMSVLGGGTGNARLVVKYSTNGTSFNDMPVPGNYFTANGDAASYGATSGDPSADPAIPANPVILVNSGATALPEAQRTLMFSGMNVNLELNQTFYIRLYPYITDLTVGSNRYFMSRQVVISALASPTTLPLNFLSFTAKPDALGKSINLNWQTANEINTKEFIIEKRTETTAFVPIDKKPSNNTAGIHNYSFTDNNVSPGVAYYRLKQVDKDGVYDYSIIASAGIKGSLSFDIYPNPTTTSLDVVHESAIAASTIKVQNLSGKTLIESAVNTGSTNTKINVSSLSSGTYVLIYDGVNHLNTLKFIKQ
jgi:hypothetical protein